MHNSRMAGQSLGIPLGTFDYERKVSNLYNNYDKLVRSSSGGNQRQAMPAVMPKLVKDYSGFGG